MALLLINVKLLAQIVVATACMVPVAQNVPCLACWLACGATHPRFHLASIPRSAAWPLDGHRCTLAAASKPDGMQKFRHFGTPATVPHSVRVGSKWLFRLQ